MHELTDFAMHEEYKRLEKLGDRLSKLDGIIDWEAFIPLVKGMYSNRSGAGGRPNIDEIVMVKLLILQEWYGLSDPELEKQVVDRISFRRFLGYPEIIPDHTTVWYFRERLKESGKDKEIWKELQRQLEAKGLKIRKGIIQDATIITSDPGHDDADKPRGDDAKTRRSKDGAWGRQRSKTFFGFKLHTKVDMQFNLVREFATTAASVNDIHVDLSQPGEVAYRDRGYQGSHPKAFDATMKRAARNHPNTIRDELRNRRIKKKRSPGERVYAVMKNVFRGGHTKVTTIARVNTKMTFLSFAYNLYQLITLKKQGVI